MISLAKLSIRRPKAALGAWLVTAIALTLIGFGVSKTLSPTVTVVPGTESSRAQQLANAQFGPTQLVPILLEGPKAQLDKQGPKLVAAITKRKYTRALSAWDTGTASAGLRPSPNAAMIVVSVDRSEKKVVQYDQPQIENLVSHQISAPVKSYITGQPSIDRADRDASLSNLRSTEAIAIGVLFLLLLIGLRAPIAALLVTGIGAISMLSGFGEVALLGKFMSVDPVAVALGTMTGLALGVGFALLLLDRFHREEWPDDLHPRDAATAALRELQTTGKAVLVGGTAVIVALALVAVVGPAELMVSLGTGMLTCAAFATGGAVVVMPAALVLLGRRLDAFSFPAPAILSRGWSRLVDGGNWVTRHAVYAGFAATVLLAALAIPAFALKTGPQDISQLPAHSNARIAFQEVSRVMGPGWPTPYNMIIAAKGRAITSPALLGSMQALQTQIAKDKTVDSVSGPGAINSTSKQLSQFWPGIKHSVKISDQSKKDLLTLINGLGQAGAGSTQLQSGLAQAASGAGTIHGGSGAARTGAGKLHAGLASARAGSTKLTAGLNEALAGAQALKNGAAQALAGSSQLASGLGKGAPQVTAGLPAIGTLVTDTGAVVNEVTAARGQTQNASAAVASALSHLRSMGSAGRSDPNYAAVLNELQAASGAVGGITSGLENAYGKANGAAFIAAGVKVQVGALAPQLTAAASGAAQLEAGIKQLRDGNAQLASGITQLAGGGGQLTSGLGQLTDGAGQLQAGLALLTDGTGQLASGLSAGVGPAGQLTTGLGQMQAGVVKARGQIPSTAALKQLEKQSPGLFSSGYFVLAAVEGARASDRNAATFTINLLRGGTAGQILVISKYKADDPRTAALGTRLANVGENYGNHNNAQVAVGGPAGSLLDLTSVTKSKIWLDVALIAAALMLVLGLALRAIILPAVATAFSLLVAGSTFGILWLLFGGSDPLLGGPGHLDPATIIGTFTVAFSITVVFSTLLLMRTREAYVKGVGGKTAVRTGLRETAAAATGAGLVVVAALIPFLSADFMYVRTFGVGVASAVLLDLLIVRPVLLPAAEAVVGRFGWWPTTAPRSGEPARGANTKTRRLPRLHVPHRGPRPAHH